MATAPPTTISYEDYCLQRFQAIAQQFEIRGDYCQKLRQLEGYEIIIVCDDSGSMGTPVSNTNGSVSAFGKQMTRWDELRNTVSLIVDIGSTLDKSGLDIYFLNRPSVSGITTSQQIQPIFAIPPSGWTPLTATLTRIFHEKASAISEKKVLLVIATDGQPTDTNGNVDIQNFMSILKKKHKNVYVSILACTDDENSVGYLNNIDKVVSDIDVVDDYRSERKEIQQVQGNEYAFSFGDYVVKALLGPIDPYFDSLDEKKSSTVKNSKKEGCVIV